MEKRRLDVLVVERGLAPSRNVAQAYIRRGFVSVDGRIVTKPGTLCPADVSLALVKEPPKYVSRGALKLAPILDRFGITPEGKVCLDVGASTGGFTQVLLERGAKKVYAVDVGYGQLMPQLRKDPRVIVMERTNARYLTREQIRDRIEFVTMDVSFISVTKILPVLVRLDLAGDLLVLVKPQFELGPREVGRGGVVRDPEKWKQAMTAVADAAREVRYSLHGVAVSPEPGAKGNREFFLHLRYPAGAGMNKDEFEEAVRRAIDEAIATI